MSCIESLPSDMAYELTDAVTDIAPNYRITRRSEVVIQDIMTDIQKAVDQLSHMSSFDDPHNYEADVDEDGNSWHKAVRPAADGHVPLTSTATSTNNNLGNGDVHEAFPNNETLRRPPGEDKHDYRKFVLTKNAVTKAGIHTHADASHLPFPRSEDRPTWVPMDINSDDATSLPPWSTTSSISHSHRYSVSRAALSTGSLPLLDTRGAALPTSGDRRCAHPACWTVQETVDWLRSKGFEDAVCQRFVEQEIAGDALLNLDVGKLKTEIGIAAYGKRVRIESAIAECRRLAKVMSSSAIQSVGPPASQLTALERAPLRSASVGNLLLSRSPHDPGDLRRSPSVPMQRSTEPAGDPGQQSADEKSDPTMGLRLWVSSLLSSGGRQGGTTDRRTSQLSVTSPDGATSPSAKDVVVEQEEKGDLVERGDNSAKDLASHSRDDQFDDSRNVSSLPVKLTSPKSMKFRRLLSPETPNVKRSQSLSEWRKDRSRALSPDRQLSPSGSISTGVFPKLRRRYFGGEAETSTDPSSFSVSRLSHDNDVSKSSATSVGIDADTGCGKEDQPEERDSNYSGNSDRDHTLPPKPELPSVDLSTGPSTEDVDSMSTMFPGILTRIGTPDHEGWMRKKGGFYNTWKRRYFVLKGTHLYWVRSNSLFETKVEGHINTIGYRIIPDENINPGRYGFKLEHELNPTHFFSSNEKTAIRGWISALLKLKIHDCAVTASPANISVIPLAVAQALDPPPRPPSPAPKEEARGLRRRNSNLIRDYFKTTSFFSDRSASTPTSAQHQSPVRQQGKGPEPEYPLVEPDLIKWANGHLQGVQITSKGSICSRFKLLRIAQSIKNTGSSTVPDICALSREHDGDVLDGLFSLIDLLIDKEVEADGVDIIEDMRQGSREEVIRLLKALRAWEQRRAVLESPGMSPLRTGSSTADVSGRSQSKTRINEEASQSFLFTVPSP